MKDLKQMAEEAKKILSALNDGEVYASGYVTGRFVSAAEQTSGDQLIANMSDVFQKKASEKMFITQKEIGEVYNSMYGLSGGKTAFRDYLGDLLPANMQLAKIAYKSSPMRTQEENHIEPIYKESELSNAFSIIFGMESPKANASSQVDVKSVKTVVLNKLASLGKIPTHVELSGQNEHFILATAIYKDRAHRELSLQIPVQLVNGVAQLPEVMIQSGVTIPLNRDNLYVHLKETSSYKKASERQTIAGDVGKDKIESANAVLPASLKAFVDFETDMIKAASNFSPSQVQHGITLVASELASYSKAKNQIKVASSEKNSITFATAITAGNGAMISIKIPVEYAAGKPMLPSKFAVDSSNTDTLNSYYDFDSSGFAEMLSHVDNKTDNLNKIARINSPMGEMSYHQLMNEIVTASKTKDFGTAEDAIGVISAKFGQDMGTKALREYGDLLKSASTLGSKRQEFIKNAKMRGELILLPTSTELYNFRLGLPVSKIEFDTDGTMYPKGRLRSYNSDNDDVVIISTSKIVLT